MSAVQVVQNNVVSFNAEQLKLLKTTIAKDATNDELSLFINQCQRTGLDPFTRQIYFIKDKNGKVTICTSIDGLRLVAERTGKYEGQTEQEWCGDDGVWKTVWLSDETPKAARIGVWKSGFKAPTYAVAIFKEYAGFNYKNELNYMWNKMPANMISKTAEALALRKAFPNDLSGLYATEEVAQAVEAFEAREANTTPTASQQLADAKDPYIFDGGKFQGKKFGEISPKDFDAELKKYKDVPQITANLQKLIDRMEKFKKENRPPADPMAALDEKLGLSQKESMTIR